MVEIGDIFEEEDFNPHDYGLKVPLPEWMQRKESGAGVTAADVLDGDACVAKYEEVLKEGKDAYGDSELYRRICLRFALYRAFKRIADVPTEENGKRIKRDFEEARATARRILEEEDIKGIYYEVQDLAEALEEDEMEQNWTVNYGEPWRHPLSLPHISDLDEFLSYIYVPNMVKRHIEEHYDKDTGLRKIPDVVQERFITEIN